MAAPVDKGGKRRNARIGEDKMMAEAQQERMFSAAEIGNILKAVISQGADFRFQSRGWSMSPFIRDGDILTVSPLKETRIRTGQVVAVLIPGDHRLVIHRVVRKKGRYYEVKGDNLLSTDGLFTREQIIGVVTRRERKKRVRDMNWTVGDYLVALISRSKWGVRLMQLVRELRRRLRGAGGRSESSS